MTVMDERGATYLKELGSLSLADLSVEPLLDRIARTTAEVMQADACAILLLGPARKTLFFKGSHGFNKEAINTVRLHRGAGVVWRVVTDRATIATGSMRDHPDFYPVPESGEGRYHSFLGTPILDGDDCIGVLYAQRTDPSGFGEDERRRIEEIARWVAGSVRAGWLMDLNRERVRRLETLNRFTQEMALSDSPADIVEHIAAYASALTGARVQFIWLATNAGPQQAYVSPGFGDDPHPRQEALNRLVAEAMAKRATVRIDDVHRDPALSDGPLIARRSLLCVPMVSGEIVTGALCVADRVGEQTGQVYPFSGEEEEALEFVATTGGRALHRAQTAAALGDALDENRRNVRELSILFQLSMAMQRAIRLDDLLRMILSCVTVGSGLGFNRAILFLANEEEGTIDGAIGLGPASGEEAARIWGELDGAVASETDLIDWLLRRERQGEEDSAFNRMARSVRCQLDGRCAVATAVKERRPVNVASIHDDGGCTHRLVEMLGNDRFAVVPLVAHDEPLGAILVDNSFTGRPITDNDLRLLARFAAPAAWAIENVRLVERLGTANRAVSSLEQKMARVERMTALGEIYAELAHELKNPLMTIGGFARRLAATADQGSRTGRYSRIIVSEVARLEGLLAHSLKVSREGDIELQRTPVDVNRLIKETLDLYWRAMGEAGIETRLKLGSGLPRLSADEPKLKQVLINLLLNSMEALSCGRHDLPKRVTVETRLQKENRSWVDLLVTDTGGGIAPLDEAHLFEPFFTTKQTGTGLGLPLCKKIVQLHEGVLEIDNRLGDGVTLKISLPVL